jgi:hypothetical protein
MFQSSNIENQTNMVSNIMRQDVMQITPFCVGEVVDVESRTWPGINKPGGTARVKSFDVASGSYCVSYMLGGKEDGIEAQYVKAHSDEPVARQRRQTALMNVEAPVAAAKKKRKPPPPSVLCESGLASVVSKVKRKQQKKRKTVPAPVPSSSSSEAALVNAVLTCDESDDVSSGGQYQEEYEGEEYEEEEYGEEECEEETCGEEECEEEECGEEECEEEACGEEGETSPSPGTAAALALMHEAFRQCAQSGDGVYAASAVEDFILSRGLGVCSREDVAACFARAEEENKIMLDVDDEARRSIYLI